MKSLKTLKITAIVSGILAVAHAIFPFIVAALVKIKFKMEMRGENFAGAIGVIGGADGPTAIYTASTADVFGILILRYGFSIICALVCVVAIVIYFVKSKRR